MSDPTPLQRALEAVNDLVERVTRFPPADPAAEYAALLDWIGFLKEENARRGLPRSTINQSLSQLRHSMAILLGQEPSDGHDLLIHAGWAIGAVWGLQSFCAFGPALPDGWRAGRSQKPSPGPLRH